MRVTFFDSVSKPRGKLESFASFEAFYLSKLQKPVLRDIKDGQLFSLATFKTNYRIESDVTTLAGFVLDFDNEAAEDSPDTIDTIANNLGGLCFAAYTTFSHSPDKPKFRVVVPAAVEIPPQRYRESFFALVELLGNPAGLDWTSVQVARSYYLPACPKENEGWFHSEFQPGKLWVPEFVEGMEVTHILPTEKAHTNGIHHGRNNALKAQVSAALGKGASFEQTVLDIVRYDKEHHNPPLFGDKNEGYIPGAPEAGAAKFVSHIWFSHARNHGDIPKFKAEEISIQIIEKGAEIPKTGRPKKLFHLPKKLIEATPGLVGEIASWITDTAQKPQPVLSLGAALACVGVLKGHRVQTETGLRTNLYLLGLGPSGCGKEHPSRAIQMLLEQSDNAMLLSGKPASDSGLLRSIKVNRGKTLICWDEIGHALMCMTGQNSAPHERKIINLLMELFTKAGSTYYGKEYSNSDGKSERYDVKQPCLSVWGTTVQERLIQALTSDFAVDGFLPRWLILQVDNPDVGETDCRAVEDVPEHFINRIKEVSFLPKNVRATGNLDAANNIRPAIIPYADGFAKKYALDCRKEFAEKRKLAREAGSGLDAIWNRAFEHLLKLALVVTDGDSISDGSLRWAHEVSNRLTESTCELVTEHLAENRNERNIKRVLKVIADNPGITHWTLIQKTRFLASQERRNILGELIECENIIVWADKTTNAQRPLKKYTLNRLGKN